MNEIRNHDLEAMLEGLIFVSKEPITPERMSEVLTASGIEIDTREIKKVLSGLWSKWQDQTRLQGRGMVLSRVAGGYVFASAPELSVVVKKIAITRPMELSKAQMEVLSVVAYRQPITRVDIDDIRGVDNSHVINRLMQFKLLKILGKSEGLGRPLLYGTTKHFLEFFSLNSLNDLPVLKQFDSLDHGGEIEKLDPDHGQVKLADLFQACEGGSMFSDDVQQQSDEALRSLDEALLCVDSVEKKCIELK